MPLVLVIDLFVIQICFVFRASYFYIFIDCFDFRTSIFVFSPYGVYQIGDV